MLMFQPCTHDGWNGEVRELGIVKSQSFARERNLICEFTLPYSRILRFLYFSKNEMSLSCEFEIAF